MAARIEPSTANPAVEPSARCALMMPDAIPERSAGTAVIASEVIGVRHNAVPMPTMARPALTTIVFACIPTIRTASPMICDARPRKNQPARAHHSTSFPAVSDKAIMLTLYDKRTNPASVGEKPCTFCRYCVITSTIPYKQNTRRRLR